MGDTWEMYIGLYCLSAHSIEFQKEKIIYDFLKKNYKEFDYSVDQEDIPKATIMAANLRKPITRVNLDERKNLTIDFEKGSTLRILTNTSIVDWQWCFNKSGKSPYSEYEIACFWEGEILIKS